MESKKINPVKSIVLLLSVSTVLFAFYFYFHIPLDYENCPLCDRNEYKKVYDYFEHDSVSQIKFPYYARPIVPLLAAWFPSSDMVMSFHVINFIFVLLGVFAIWKLWFYLKFPNLIAIIGLCWLTLHWSGIIRYNLMDFVTVDVPVYFVEALALLLFLKGKFKWFYLLTPLAILQKESFTPILILFIFFQLFQHRKSNWWQSSKHLIFSLAFGIFVQKAVVWWLPEQQDQRVSIMALFWHLRWALDDPTRFIRWFAAFGCAYGVFPLIMAYRFNINFIKNETNQILILMTILFLFLGIAAGEDMTRIMFLGFPFIMTLSLKILKEERLPVIIGSVVLSIPFMRLYPFYVDSKWSVDYAPLPYVYEWAGYFILATVLLFAVVKISDRRI